MERNQKKLKRILPKREDKQVETSYLMSSFSPSHRLGERSRLCQEKSSDQWDEKPTLSKRVHVKMILPNFRVKGRSVYFILEPQMWVVLDKMYVEDQFIMESEGSIISVQYRLYTEEDHRGLRCEVMICDDNDLYHGDFQFIGKLVELNILGINHEKTYQLMDFRQELFKKKKMKKIPQILQSSLEQVEEKSRKRIIPIEDEE